MPEDLQHVYQRLRATFPFSDIPFEEAALAVFRFQAQANPVYAQWLELLKKDWQQVQSLVDIPFLPIEFFKTHLVTSHPGCDPLRYFYSSRTTGQVPSKSPVYDLDLYKQAARLTFEQPFGPLDQFFFISLLPSYSQTGESSLVHMVHDFALAAGQDAALKIEPEAKSLHQALAAAKAASRKPILFGVTHALLSLTDTGTVDDPFLLFETGGMKGRGTELTRPELHTLLRAAFPAADIRSEYGMTELFSQGYTTASGSEHFTFPSWVRGQLRDPTDPLSLPPTRTRGALNLIDLANLDTCAFLATSDQAELTPQGLAILGRLDHSEIRGCNLLTL